MEGRSCRACERHFGWVHSVGRLGASTVVEVREVSPRRRERHSERTKPEPPAARNTFEKGDGVLLAIAPDNNVKSAVEAAMMTYPQSLKVFTLLDSECEGGSSSSHKQEWDTVAAVDMREKFLRL